MVAMANESWNPTPKARAIVEDAQRRAREAPPRPLLLKLVLRITDRIGHKVTVEDPEYWGLMDLVTDEMCEVALTMKVRKPMTLTELCRATHRASFDLEPLLTEMAIVGLLEYNWENPRREKQWILLPFVPGSAEFVNMQVRRIDEHPEIAPFFEHMTRLPLEKVTPMVPPGGAGIGMHVIPVERAIEAENQTADIEHISHWLKKYDGKYAVGLCSCRAGRIKMEEATGDDPMGWCIAVGDMADYAVQTYKDGHYADYDEVMEVLQRAEDNGFVHQITNIDGQDKIFAICNCNIDTCYALRTSQLFNTPNMSRSAYVAHVDDEACVACGRCVETCPAGALKLGQKLPTTDGPVRYPRQELPDEVKWGPEKWNLDYRDTNRVVNCHDAGTSPCKTACPAHIAVQGYLKLAAQGRYTEALALIKRENPFPAVCGRICNRACEDACTRCRVDEAVAIDEVKKFIAQQDLDAETRYVPPVVQPSNGGPFAEKIAIVGAGPAGLSCAFYLAQKGYRPTVFEREDRPGGMLVHGIPSYKLDPAVVEAEIDVIRALGVEIRCGVEVGRDVTLDELRAQGYQAFYLAIGAQGGRRAGVSGEEAHGVMSAVEFLRAVAKARAAGEGASARACGVAGGAAGVATQVGAAGAAGGAADGAAAGGAAVDVAGVVSVAFDPLAPSAHTVVIGGGNVAVDAALTSARLGAGTVDMVCLEPRDAMPASEEEVAEALEGDVDLACGWGVKEILAEGGVVSGIVLKRCTSVFDYDTGAFAPTYDEADTRVVECDRVILALGQSIEWGGLLEGSRVELGRGGTALADGFTYQTAEPDVFVGGDAFTGPSFAIDAIAAGKEAALSLHRFVRPGASLTLGRNRREFIAFDKDNLVIEGYDTASRQVPPRASHVGRMDDARLPLTEEQVKAETARCLGCGVSVVDPNRCIGCGLCTTRCAFDAIHLRRDRPECSAMVRSEDKLKAIGPYALKREIKIRRAVKGNGAAGDGAKRRAED